MVKAQLMGLCFYDDLHGAMLVKSFKKYDFLLSWMVLISGIMISGTCSAQEVDFVTKAQFALVMDADKNIVFFDKNSDVPMAPASMSKLMTVALIFRDLKAGRLKLDTPVRMSVNAWRKGGAPSRTSAMFVPVKSNVSVEQILRGLIIQSGNDAAIAIAEHISGTEEKFAKQMEAYGREIGLTHSTFRNATGLPHPKHLMSARDLAKLARHLIYEFPNYYAYFAEPSFKYRRFNFINRNPMLSLKAGYDGLKTGYTDKSKYGLVVSLKRDGRRLIGVFNGLQKKTERKKEAHRAINWVFANFVPRAIEASTQKFSARVWGGKSGSVGLSTAGDLKVFAPIEDDSPEIISEVIYQGPLKAPITQGQSVAKLRIKIADTVQEFDLFADETVAESNFISKAFDSLFYLIFGWIF